jgi:hypothetical protein
MKKLSRLLSILFLVLLFLISSRFVFFISYVKSQKTEFRKQLLEQNAGETKVLKFNQHQLFKDGNGFEWKENNKELVINGTYYEVISIKKNTAAYTVILIEDKEENVLFKSYFHLNKKAKNTLKDMSELLLVVNYLQNTFEYNLKQNHQNICYLPFNRLFTAESFKANLLKPPALFLIS